MNAMTRNALAALALLPALACAAGGDDVIWGQSRPDGSVTLTNSPDQQGYHVVVQGSGATMAPPVAARTASAPQPPAAGESTAATSTAELPAAASAAAAPAPAVELADPPAEPQKTLPTREAIQEAAAAAARTAEQSPEAIQAMASTVAGQAFQDMSSAGSAGERLTSMYQASQGAFASLRAASPAPH